MAEPDYKATINRILEILKADSDFASKISEFRFGDLPKEEWGNDYPLCYVTTAASPENFRTAFASQGDINKLPPEKRELEFWVVIVTGEADAKGTQQKLYDITNIALNILQNNIQLRDINGENPLCATLKIFTQGRLERNKGKLLEAMTIRVRPIVFVAS